jgi:hypothetical protein
VVSERPQQLQPVFPPAQQPCVNDSFPFLLGVVSQSCVTWPIHVTGYVWISAQKHGDWLVLGHAATNKQVDRVAPP